ncbi:MAG: hypothetical protein BWK73_36060 [Thiothrix lacustris]|uniref:ATP-binding protein n=1 Tax=Thiothrix lacustris TaxID=525917 RepID=A0A1Y1QFK0_9GAMM|nr:MAG: hypothetical protein BWK73_36060 [Thiothrix lacustris]
MGIEDWTKPAQGASASPTSTIEAALSLAEQGDFSGILNTAFTEAVRKVRGLDNDYYVLKIKPRIKALKAAPITVRDFDKLTTPPKQPKQRYTEQTDDSDGGQPRKGKADLFIELVRGWVDDLFSDESGRAYASFTVEPTDRETGEVLTAHRETWALDSKQFKGKASKEFYKHFGTVAGESAMKEALEIINADTDEAPRQPVYLRYAPIPEAAGVYVDLCNDQWEVVEVTATGWRVIAGSECKAKFRRVQHSKPVPPPERGGDIADLWKHVNVQGDDSRLLVLAWLLDVMRVTTHYPVLELVAGQGSAKSTTQERLRMLTDPSTHPLRQEPRSIENLSVSCGSNHVVSLNNLSHLSTATQDFMCSMSTGGGDAARKLYTTDDEVAWDTKRPIVMNGINQLVTRPDLADRTICIELQKVEYVDDTTLTAAWQEDYPKIVGSLYTLLANTLRELPAVQLAKNPRMGDFARLGVAMVKAMNQDADFLAAYNRNRDEVVRRGVESSPVALALVGRIRAKGMFEGSLTDLMATLQDFRPEHYDKAAYPKSARGMGETVRRLAPALLVYGIEVIVHPRKNDSIPYTIRAIDKQTDTVVTEL